MNVNLFKSTMVLHGDTQVSLSKALGISRMTLSNKIHGKNDFNQAEIVFIKDRYGLNAQEVDAIFFDVKVSLKDTNTKEA